jgi:hypothetical protein
MKHLIFGLMLSVFMTGCQTSAPACTKILSEFYEEAASDDMNMDVRVDDVRKVFIVFNTKSAKALCFNTSGADYYRATTCTSNSVNVGACRWKDGRYMGYAYGDLTPQDLLEGVK